MSHKKIVAGIALVSLLALCSCGSKKNKKDEESHSSSLYTSTSSKTTSSRHSTSSSIEQSHTVTSTSSGGLAAEAIEYIGPEDTPDISMTFSLDTNRSSKKVEINVTIMNQSAIDAYFVNPRNFQFYVISSDNSLSTTLQGQGDDRVISPNSSIDLTNLFSDITQDELENNYAIAYGEGPNSHTLFESDTMGKLATQTKN